MALGWPLGADAAVAIGESHATGKNESGAPLDNAAICTATDVREGGMWKAKMLTVNRQAQPNTQLGVQLSPRD